MFELFGSRDIKKALDFLTERHCISNIGNIYFFDNGQVKLEERKVIFSLKSVYLPMLSSKITSINGVSTNKIEINFGTVYTDDSGHITLDVNFADPCVKELHIGDITA